MLTEEPCISLGTCQTGAMDAALLTGTHTDSLAVHSIADGIGLGVLQGNQCHNQVNLGRFRQFLIGGNHIFQQMLTNLKIITALLKGNAEYLLAFLRIRNIVRVNLYNIVAALTLILQNSQSLIGISGSNHAVRNLRSNQGCGQFVTNIAECNPVTKGAHTVGTTGAHISTSKRIFIQAGNIFNKACLLQILRQGLTNCGRGGGNVLERGCTGHTGSFLQLLYQLPGVQCIHKVDVAGTTVQNGNGQLGAVVHIQRSRLLIGVATVFQFKFLHFSISFY